MLRRLLCLLFLVCCAAAWHEGEIYDFLRLDSPNIPIGRTDPGAVFLNDRYYCIHGGCVTSLQLVLGDMRCFNMDTGEWIQVEVPVDVPRCGQSLTLVRNDTLVLFGGGNNGVYYNDVYVFTFSIETVTDYYGYEVETITLTQETIAISGSPPSKRGYHSATVLPGDKILYFGGYDQNSTAEYVDLNDLWLLDCTRWAWYAMSTTGDYVPDGRDGHVAAYFGEHVYVFGGINWANGLQMFELDVVDVSTILGPTPSGPVTWLDPIGLPRGPLARAYGSGVSFGELFVILFGAYVDPSYTYVYYRDGWALNASQWDWRSLNITGAVPSPRWVSSGRRNPTGNWLALFSGGTDAATYTDMYLFGKECLAGHRFDGKGELQAVSCFPCEPGTNSSQGRQNCSLCPLGHYANVSGAAVCVACPLSTYADTEGAAICSECPAHSVTTVTGAASLAQCLCDVGYYGNATQQCRKCPRGGTCDEIGMSTPKAKAGWWRDTNDESKFLPCLPPEACPSELNGQCDDGYEGYKCSQCSERYYRRGGKCYACTAAGLGGLVTLFVIVPVAVAVGFVIKARRPPSGAVTLAVDFAQVLGLLMSSSSTYFAWPFPIATVLLGLSAININLDIFSFVCEVQMSYWARLGVFTAMPFVFASVLALVFAVRVLHMRYRYVTGRMANDKPFPQCVSEEFDHFVHAMCSFLSVAFAVLALKAVEPFRCERDVDGSLYLSADPSIPCFGDEWKSHLPLVLFNLILYIVAPVALSFIFFVRIHLRRGEIVENESTRGKYVRRLGLLTTLYHLDWWFWGGVLKLRRLALVLLGLITSPIWYTTFTSLILLVSTLSFTSLRPFAVQWHNVMQITANAIAYLFFFAAVLLASEQIPQRYQQGISVVLMVLIISMGIAFILCFWREVRRNVPQWMKRKLPVRFRLLLFGRKYSGSKELSESELDPYPGMVPPLDHAGASGNPAKIERGLEG